MVGGRGWETLDKADAGTYTEVETFLLPHLEKKGLRKQVPRTQGTQAPRGPIYPQGQVSQEEAPQGPPCETAVLRGLWTSPPRGGPPGTGAAISGVSPKGAWCPHTSQDLLTLCGQTVGV